MSAKHADSSAVDPLAIWLLEHVAAVARLDADKVDLDTPIYRFGVDSRTVMLLVEEAETHFERVANLDHISPAATIRALAAAIY
jgi:hypothetical protein